jgi:hypothetical protein
VNPQDQHVKAAVPTTAVLDASPLAAASASPTDVEARLDEALQMTFPASDPISVSAQG